MDAILEHVKTELGVSRVRLLTQPTGGIVNEGKAAVVEADGRKLFIKHNDTALVSFEAAGPISGLHELCRALLPEQVFAAGPWLCAFLLDISSEMITHVTPVWMRDGRFCHHILRVCMFLKV